MKSLVECLMCESKEFMDNGINFLMSNGIDYSEWLEFGKNAEDYNPKMKQNSKNLKN